MEGEFEAQDIARTVCGAVTEAEIQDNWGKV